MILRTSRSASEAASMQAAHLRSENEVMIASALDVFTIDR